LKNVEEQTSMRKERTGSRVHLLPEGDSLSSYSRISIGLAIFSMFFGAGNIVFPLMIGCSVTQGLGWAIVGLIITAVCIPLFGLVSIFLFGGNYRAFFDRLGPIPGLLCLIFLFCIVGPFGGIPRCITFTFSTLKLYYPHLSLPLFSISSVFCIFICCWKPHRILDIIGSLLSPTLVLFLLIILIKGIFFPHMPIESSHSFAPPVLPHPFLLGIKEGYNTMDLVAALFFASLICHRFHPRCPSSHQTRPAGKLSPMIHSSLIGGSLLSLTYVGLCCVATNYREVLSGVPMAQLLGMLGHTVLGPYAGFIMSVVVVLTCWTTSIALTVSCANFVRYELWKKRHAYLISLLLVLSITLLISFFEFTGIVKGLIPILKVLYPALFVLSFANIFYALYDIHPVKVPVFATILISMIIQYAPKIALFS